MILRREKRRDRRREGETWRGNPLLDEDGNNNNNNGSTWTWKLHLRDSSLSSHSSLPFPLFSLYHLYVSKHLFSRSSYSVRCSLARSEIRFFARQKTPFSCTNVPSIRGEKFFCDAWDFAQSKLMFLRFRIFCCNQCRNYSAHQTKKLSIFMSRRNKEIKQ